MNKVMIAGTLAAEPLSRQAGNHTVMSFRVKTVERNGDREFSTYHNCEAWRGCADNLKGIGIDSAVLVSGSLRNRQRTDITDKKVYITEINVQSVMVFDARPSAAPQQPVSNGGGFGDDDIPF